VIKVSKIGFLAALLVVFAVAIVLITPDPTDDIHGILHQRNRATHTLALMHVPAIAAVSPSAERWHSESSQDAATRSVFEFTCTYRC
jgi:hypothetical protein